jgi:ribosome-associated translation inhibitor RaiA
MHLYLTARHFELSDSIRAHVQHAIVDTVAARTEASELNRIEVQLSLGQREARYACHVRVLLQGHHEINITEENHDMHSVINLAEKRLLRALVDLRDRAKTTARHPNDRSLLPLSSR